MAARGAKLSKHRYTICTTGWVRHLVASLATDTRRSPRMTRINADCRQQSRRHSSAPSVDRPRCAFASGLAIFVASVFHPRHLCLSAVFIRGLYTAHPLCRSAGSLPAGVVLSAFRFASNMREGACITCINCITRIGKISPQLPTLLILLFTSRSFQKMLPMDNRSASRRVRLPNRCSRRLLTLAPAPQTPSPSGDCSPCSADG